MTKNYREGKIDFKILLGVVGAFLILLFVFILFFSGPKVTPGFVECLRKSGAVMYGTGWCLHCQEQKDIFGEYFDDVSYVDCDYDRAACDAARVRGYPTWKINNINYPGI